MRICFITSHLRQGGAERQVVELIKILSKKNYQITLLLYQSDIIFYQEISDLPIEIICNKKKIQRNKFINWYDNIRFLRSVLKKNKFDILHTFLFFNGLIVRLFAPTKYYNRILFSVRNSYEAVNGLFKLSERFLIRRSILVFNSQKSLDQFLGIPGTKKFKHKTFLIYNGFDEKKFAAPDKTYHDKIEFGNVGRISLQKNQIQLVAALDEFKRSADDAFSLRIIGDPEPEIKNHLLKKINQSSIKDHIEVMDSQSNIETYYKKFDVFILSSKYEGCPNVLFEALLARCFCIISKGANSDNFIEHNINGLVYNDSDEDLVAKLKYLNSIYKKNMFYTIIENGYRYALENFTLNNMAEQYQNIYTIITNSNR